MKAFSDDKCVCCGESVPEGRMVCPGCQSALRDAENAGINVELIPFDEGTKRKGRVKHEKSLLRYGHKNRMS